MHISRPNRHRIALYNTSVFLFFRDYNNAKGFKEWRQTIPKELKYLSTNAKSRNTQFRKLLFQSNFFRQNKISLITNALYEYNETEFVPGISRRKAEYYNSKLEPKDLQNIQLVSSKDLMASKIKKENAESIKKVEKELSTIINSDIEKDEKLNKIAALIHEGHSEATSIMKQGFVGLALQNAELNARLMQKNEALEKRIQQLQEQFEIVTHELQEMKKQERLVKERKEKRKNRKRMPQREPITLNLYEFLIENSYKLSYGRSYRGARLRLALAILLVISELLPLKMKQVKTLFVEHWIKIDRTKRGPSSHKAFLTREGARVMQQRLPDLELMMYSKNEDSYIFTAENSEKPLEREAFTNLINIFIKDCPRKIESNPTLTSHSFRIGYISKLWRDTSDIEFVRQTIGHAKIDTTSHYVENLSEEERKERLRNIDSTNYLVI